MTEVKLIPGYVYHIKDINTYEDVHSDMIYIGCSYVEETEICRKIVLTFRSMYYSSGTTEVDIESYYIVEAS